MKKVYIIIVLIITVIFITSCNNKEDIQSITNSTESQICTIAPTQQVIPVPTIGNVMYINYISEIDESLENYNSENYPDVRYGSFSGYYYYSNLTTIDGKRGGLSENSSDYYPYGEIISCFKDDKLMGYRMEIGWNTDGNYQKGGDYKYQCEKYLMENDMIYYSYSTDCNDVSEIPSFMFIDGITCVRYDKESQDYTGKYALENTTNHREYISIAGVLYEVDRNKQTISKIENSIVEEYIKWCECQQRDIITAHKSFQMTPEMVEKLIPKGFNFSKSQYDYSVADIDSDGIDDILVEIFPIQKEYAYNGDFSEESPYRKIDEYGYTQLWVLKGKDNGTYEAQKLMDSIVWDETYTLCDINAFDGGFTMKYFVGRSPFETTLRKFQYNREKQDWFLASQYKNSSYVKGIEQGLTISGPREYGERYLLNSSDNTYYNVSVEKFINDNYRYLLASDYEDYGCLIHFTDKETTDKVTGVLNQELGKIFDAIKKLDECHDILLQNNSGVFLNEKILVVSFTIMDDTANGTSIDRVIPICIDLNTCTLVDFQKYLAPDEFIKLCEDSNVNITNLNELYEHYGDYEYLLKAASQSITLCLTEEGLVILETDEYWPQSYTITRDKFLDNDLSDFWDDWP